MAPYVAALLIGFVAGLRTFTAPAAVSWAAFFGIQSLQTTPLAFLATPIAAYLLAPLAIVEFVADILPKTPSRKVSYSFAARLISGALSGAALGAIGGALVGGLIAGIVGAVIGTLVGYDARIRLAKAFRSDLPAALIEDLVAVVGAALIVTLIQ